MTWQRRGRIFDPADYPNAVVSHAQVPTVLDRGTQLRIYYADRTTGNHSFIAFLDVDADEPARILRVHADSLLAPAAAGTFDDDGAMPAWVLPHDGQIWLYYSGWNRGVTVPYRNSIGLAVSDDGGATFRRKFEGPIMDRTAEEPYIAVTPTIVRDGDRWRMWYISGLRWTAVDGHLEPVYVIKDAASADGIRWERPNRQVVAQRHPDEAFSHPSVLRTASGYHLWFCARNSHDYRDGAGAYRIGYARSPDGVAWERDDAFGGLDVAPDGWDATMTAYPYVIRRGDQLLMFYNGNGFGRSGIGYAEWKGALP